MRLSVDGYNSACYHYRSTPVKTCSALILLALAAAARAEIRWQSPQEAYQSGYFNDAFDEYGEKLFSEAQAAPKLAELLTIFAQEAAAHGAAWQGWDAAEALYRDGKYAEALAAFQRLAEDGNRLAALRVAEQYRQGKGVAPSNEQYRFWFEQAVPGLPYGDYPRYDLAARSEDAETRYAAAQMYIYGAGVREDYFAAARLLQPLAEAGDTRAMSELGGLYLEGLGVDEDRAAGKRWLEKAVQAGDAEAAELLQILEQAR